MQKLLLCILLFAVSCDDGTNTSKKQVNNLPPEKQLLQQKFRKKIDSLLPFAKKFIKDNNYNNEYFFIADLSMHSGFERFAVVDIKNDSMLNSGLVAHGAGGRYFSATAKFSNIPNSYCSSLGKYKIANKYDGRFGKAYKLYGLDKTNNKAFERCVVLHAYDCVPDNEIYPTLLCNSEGCPMVSYKFLTRLSSYIDKSKKPVLLWIVN